MYNLASHQCNVYYYMSLLDILTDRKQSRFEKQLRPYLDMLYRYAYRLTGNQYDAEDLVQELLVKLFDKSTDLRKLENPQTWLLKSLYHKFIDFTRQQSRNPSLPGNSISEDILHQLPAPQNSIQTMDDQQHANNLLESAMAHLNPDQKAVITLYDIEGYSLADISQILDTPIGTLKSRLHRARAILKKSIKREPFPPSRRVTG